MTSPYVEEAAIAAILARALRDLSQSELLSPARRAFAYRVAGYELADATLDRLACLNESRRRDAFQADRSNQKRAS